MSYLNNLSICITLRCSQSAELEQVHIGQQAQRIAACFVHDELLPQGGGKRTLGTFH